MLATFQGVVEHGQIRWIGVAPPDGEVVVVAHAWPSVEQQLARLAAIPLEERHRAFDEFARQAEQAPAPQVDVDSVSDKELVAIVHEVRQVAEREE